MTTWLQVEGGRAVQGVYGATPLALISAGDTANLPSVMEMLLGTRGGCMGETCAIALILGGVYMIWKKVTHRPFLWHSSAAYSFFRCCSV